MATTLYLAAAAVIQISNKIFNKSNFAAKQYFNVNIGQTNPINSRRLGTLTIDEHFYLSGKGIEYSNTFYYLEIIRLSFL